MGFVDRTKQAEAAAEETRLDLENRYPHWQHAASMLNQIVSRYVAENLDLRSRLSVREETRHVTDPFLKRQKQLDRLMVIQKTTGRTISLEALPLSPPILGASGRVDIAAPHLMQEFYIVWDGGGESANNWAVKSSDRKFNERLSEKSFDEFLGRVFPASWSTAAIEHGMADYQIKSNGQSSFGVSAISERARKRGSGRPVKSDLTLMFKGRTDALESVEAGQAESFTFAGKELLG